jgi:hypothetical protein
MSKQAIHQFGSGKHDGRSHTACSHVSKGISDKVKLNNPKKPAKQRSVRRCPLVASAEVTEPRSGALLSARTSEIGLGGCYVDALNPFPEGTIVGLRIIRDQGVFETNAKIVYCDAGFGMGLAFTEMTPDQRSLLEDWLAEIVSQLRSVP